MATLEMKTNAELVEIYNRLAPDQPLKSWKGRKSVLVERIEVLQSKLADEPEKVPAPIRVVPKTPELTIRQASIDLLCQVAYYENPNEKQGGENVYSEWEKGLTSVGLTYEEIIDKLADIFPNGKTTVACLRWYAVKIRAEEPGYEDMALPRRRPRSRAYLANKK